MAAGAIDSAEVLAGGDVGVASVGADDFSSSLNWMLRSRWHKIVLLMTFQGTFTCQSWVIKRLSLLRWTR